MNNSQFSEPLWLTTYDFSPSKVTKILLSTIAFLVLFNIIERGIVYWLNAQNNGQLISIYFNFDEEANLPAFYSSLALGFCAYLLSVIATVKKKVKEKYAKQWKTLAFIFLYLAVDEMCSIHELLIPILRGAMNTKGLLYFPWVIPAFFLVIIFLIVFRKFILALPNKTKIQFILAGIVYVFGALAMELIGGYIADNYGYNTVYGIASTIEELLEMFGVVIFINALLNYLQSQASELHFGLSFEQPSKKKLNP
jgi:hypothetical protein